MYFSPFTRANPHSSLLTPTPTTPWFPLFFPRVLRIAPYSQLYRCHTPQSPDLPRPLLKTQCKLHIFYLISDLHPAPAFQDAPPLPPSTQAKCSRPPSPSPAPRHRALGPPAPPYIFSTPTSFIRSLTHRTCIFYPLPLLEAFRTTLDLGGFLKATPSAFQGGPQPSLNLPQRP